MEITKTLLLLTSCLALCESETYVLPYDKTRAVKGELDISKPKEDKKGDLQLNLRYQDPSMPLWEIKTTTPTVDTRFVFENGIIRSYRLRDLKEKLKRKKSKSGVADKYKSPVNKSPMDQVKC